MSKPSIEILPTLERGALVLAQLAWIETLGPPVNKTEAAIRAYLWAAEYANRSGIYPSLNEWREAAKTECVDE